MLSIFSSTVRGSAVAFVFGALCFASTAWSEIIFYDDFESATLSSSENGFRWKSSARVSIVRDDQYRVWVSGSEVNDGPYEGRTWENGPASVGRHAMRFTYKPGVSMSEQRFSLGGAYPEVWIGYWIRVPDNYVHGASRGLGGNNQKFLAVWTNRYSDGTGPTVIFNMWDEEDDWSADLSSGTSYSTIDVHDASNINSSHKEKFPGFIRFPEDQGRWMHIVARYKIASSWGAEDGIVQWWRRWEDEGDYTLLSDRQNLGIGVQSGPEGFSAGYLMGWANGQYDETTEFLVDDFTVSTSSLLASGPRPSAPTTLAAD